MSSGPTRLFPAYLAGGWLRSLSVGRLLSPTELHSPPRAEVPGAQLTGCGRHQFLHPAPSPSGHPLLSGGATKQKPSQESFANSALAIRAAIAGHGCSSEPRSPVFRSHAPHCLPAQPNDGRMPYRAVAVSHTHATHSPAHTQRRTSATTSSTSRPSRHMAPSTGMRTLRGVLSSALRSLTNLTLPTSRLLSSSKLHNLRAGRGPSSSRTRTTSRPCARRSWAPWSHSRTSSSVEALKWPR